MREIFFLIMICLVFMVKLFWPQKYFEKFHFWVFWELPVEVIWAQLLLYEKVFNYRFNDVE